MRIGTGLPIFGIHAGPESIAAVAEAAESLGFSSVWTFERLLVPEANSYGLPTETAGVYDPLETLAFVAAQTDTIRLGTAVVDALFHPPVVLARRLATVDRLSGGRLVAGLGQGWMPEEYAVADVSARDRGRRFEEYLEVLHACWAPDPVRHTGDHYAVPAALIGPKPTTHRVPVLIGGVVRPAVERAARLGHGFVAALQHEDAWDEFAGQLAWYREAGGHGPVVLRVNGEKPDFAHAAELGIDEIVWDMTFTGRNIREQIAALQELASEQFG